MRPQGVLDTLRRRRRGNKFTRSIMVRILQTQIPPSEVQVNDGFPGDSFNQTTLVLECRRSFPARFPSSERDRIDRGSRFSAFYCDDRTRKMVRRGRM